MKLLTEMVGVPAIGTATENAWLYRTESGRLVIVGDSVDVFALLHWIEQNPLTNYREISPPTGIEPSDTLAHLFDGEGRAL